MWGFLQLLSITHDVTCNDANIGSCKIIQSRVIFLGVVEGRGQSPGTPGAPGAPPGLPQAPRLRSDYDLID